MKSLIIGGTVITSKKQAIAFLARAEKFLFEKNGLSYETILALDNYQERLVNAGFLTWDEAESAAY